MPQDYQKAVSYNPQTDLKKENLVISTPKTEDSKSLTPEIKRSLEAILNEKVVLQTLLVRHMKSMSDSFASQSKELIELLQSHEARVLHDISA